MLALDATHQLLAILCGSLVGASLALIGGGGSILALPLLLYVVGLRDPHLAIGTSALVVSINAFANLIPHARAGAHRHRRLLAAQGHGARRRHDRNHPGEAARGALRTAPPVHRGRGNGRWCSPLQTFRVAL